MTITEQFKNRITFAVSASTTLALCLIGGAGCTSTGTQMQPGPAGITASGGAVPQPRQPPVQALPSNLRKTQLGTIIIQRDISGIETPSFKCTLIHPLNKDDSVAAMVSQDHSWSVTKVPLSVGTNQVSFPILAMVKCTDGSTFTLFPAVLEFKVDVKTGEVLHLDGYQIEVKRPVTAGESIPSIIIRGDTILSLEAVDGVKEGSKAEPFLTAFKEDAISDYRSDAFEVWRNVNAWHQ